MELPPEKKIVRKISDNEVLVYRKDSKGPVSVENFKIVEQLISGLRSGDGETVATRGNYRVEQFDSLMYKNAYRVLIKGFPYFVKVEKVGLIDDNLGGYGEFNSMVEAKEVLKKYGDRVKVVEPILAHEHGGVKYYAAEWIDDLEIKSYSELDAFGQSVVDTLVESGFSDVAQGSIGYSHGQLIVFDVTLQLSS
ncbi:MAG: hypothetical protein AAB420_02930 [Patescibacteria group bacterium]